MNNDEDVIKPSTRRMDGMDAIADVTGKRDNSLALDREDEDPLSGIPEELSGGELSPTFPVGAIVLWGGSIASIPSGWGLCNGTDNATGTGIDLTDKFIPCAGGAYTVGQTGGYDTHGGATNNHQDLNLDHNHDTMPKTPPTQCAESGSSVWAWGSDPSGGAGWTCWGLTSPPTWAGEGGYSSPDSLHHLTLSETDNRPQFYALAYIEKLP